MNRNSFQSPEPPESRRPVPPERAPLCNHDTAIHRSEAILFLLLVGAVGLAFANQAKVVGRFCEHLPEFASLVAGLFRTVV